MKRRSFLHKLIRAAFAVPLAQQFIQWTPWEPDYLMILDVHDSVNGVAQIVAINYEERSITLDTPVSLDADDVVVQARSNEEHFTVLWL